jgi:hypothetical protein
VKTKHVVSNKMAGKNAELDEDSDLIVDVATESPPSKTYAGMWHPLLPIQSLSAPGTPQEQIFAFLEDDPGRTKDVLAEIAKWKKFIENTRDCPLDFDLSPNEAGQQQVTWWKKYFLKNGSGSRRGKKKA